MIIAIMKRLSMPLSAIVITLTLGLFLSHVHQVLSSNMDVLDPLPINSNQHRLWRRQETSNDSEAYCQSLRNDALCSSGAEQLDIDMNYLACENVDVNASEAEYRVRSPNCAKSESGSYCGSLFISNVEENFIKANCSEVLPTNRCTPGCRNHLENLKNTLGCCINHGRIFTINSSYSFFKNELWSVCDVSLPPTNCDEHELTFEVFMNCTYRDRFNRELSSFCASNGSGQTYVNSLLRNKRCSATNFDTAEMFSRDCTVDSQGELCWLRILAYLTSKLQLEFPIQNFKGEVEPGGKLIFSLVLVPINNACYESGDDCSSECKAILEETTNALGCCLNIMNGTSTAVSDESRLDSLVVDSKFYESCGVETPGFCSSKLSLQLESASNSATPTIYTDMPLQWISIWTAINLIGTCLVHTTSQE